MIVTAALVVLAARKANVPNIVLYIVAGLLLGPHGFDVFAAHAAEAGQAAAGGEAAAEHAGAGEGLHLVAHLGIVLMLFLVGLELSLEKIRDVGKAAVSTGLSQVVATAGAGFLLGLALGFDPKSAFFLAGAFTFSSTVVVVKLLDQKKHVHELYGRLAVGVFLVQDMVVILALTFLAGMATQSAPGAWPIVVRSAQALAGMAALLGAALLAARYLLAKPMAWIAAYADGALVWSLAWCFGMVSLAEALKLSPEIGAFLAGLSLAQLPTSGDLRRRVHPLMNFFIAIFFISLGAGMDLSAAKASWAQAIVFSLFVLGGKLAIVMFILARSGYSEKTSFLASATVAQVSEFSFVLAAMAKSVGLIDASIQSLVGVVGLVTIAASSFMILAAEKLYEKARGAGMLRPFRARQVDEAAPRKEMSGHVIVVGMNAMGRRLVELLVRRGETTLAIDTDPRKLRGLRCQTMVGSVDHHSLLDEIGLHHAKLVVSTLRIEDTNNLLAYRCHECGVPAAIHAFDRSVVDELRRHGVDRLIDPRAPWQALVAGEMARLDRLHRIHFPDPTEGTD